MFDVQASEVLGRVTSRRLSEQYLLDGQVLFEALPLPGVAARLATAGLDTPVLTDRFGGFRLPLLARSARIADHR
jgi:hypothetical protein